MASPSCSDSSLKNYVFEEEIGQGSFATVYRASHKESGVTVAVKAVHRHKLNRKLLENLSLEISILQKIRHPNIVRLLEIHHSEKFIYLVMEYCDGSDLASLIKRVYRSKKSSSAPNLHQIPPATLVAAPSQQMLPRLSEAIVQKFVLQLASALECLRANHLIHRDLKPQNLLLTSKNIHTASLKIADFGFARYVSTSDLADTLCGSPLYMAPEILRYEKYDAKADLWSVGAIMYEMLLGRPPFRAQNHIQLLKKIEATDLDAILPTNSSQSHHLSAQCLHLIRSLLRKDPLERIGFEEFFMHPFLRLLDLSTASLASLGSSSAGSLAVLKLLPDHAPLPLPSSYIPIPAKSGRSAAGPHSAKPKGAPSAAVTFTAVPPLAASAKAAFSLTGIGMRRRTASGSLSSDNQSPSSSSYRTSYWIQHTGSSREPSLSPPSKSESIGERAGPSFPSSKDSSIFDLSSPTFAPPPSSSSSYTTSRTALPLAAHSSLKGTMLDLTSPNLYSLAKTNCKQPQPQQLAHSLSQLPAPLSSSMPKTWSYLSDQTRRRPTGPLAALFPLSTPTDRVVALGESFDKDFVIIEKGPMASLTTPVSLSDPKIIPQSNQAGECAQSSEPSWPFAHLMRRISIPIPGYTVPKDHSMGRQRKALGNPEASTSTTAPPATEDSERLVSKSFSTIPEQTVLGSGTAAAATIERLAKSSQDDIRSQCCRPAR